MEPAGLRACGRVIVAVLFASTFLPAGTAMGQKTTDLASLVPAAVDGWKAEGRDGTWTPDTLYRYINGGAELYISFGFTRSFSRRYVTAGQPKASITVDLFEMGSAADAFGVFAHSREQAQDDVGQGSEYGGGLLHFWKGRYYVSILGRPETPGLKASLLKLGTQIAASIAQPGAIPPIVSSLPGEGLRRSTIRYFRHPIWLNSHVFISDDNILHLGPDSAAVLARYDVAGKAWILLVVEYPSAARAEQAQADFLKGYAPGAKDGIGAGQDKKWAGCGRLGARLAAVLSAPDRDTVGRAIAQALKTRGAGRSSTQR